jgi:hypothetical protein
MHKNIKLDRLMVVNFLKNLPHLYDYDLQSAFGLEAISPVAIIGPGPSLNDDLQRLHRIHDKCITMVLQRALPAVINHISPDFVIAADPQEQVFSHYNGAEIGANIVDLCVDPRVFGYCTDPCETTYWLNAHGQGAAFTREFFNNKSTVELHPGGSVVCTAIELAHRWHAPTILLFGIDLCLDSERNQHYNGHISEHPRICTEGAMGGTVHTVAPYVGFKKWIERYAWDNELRHRLVNCSRGARIRGITNKVNALDVMQNRSKEMFRTYQDFAKPKAEVKRKLTEIDGKLKESAEMFAILSHKHDATNMDKLEDHVWQVASMPMFQKYVSTKEMQDLLDAKDRGGIFSYLSKSARELKEKVAATNRLISTQENQSFHCVTQAQGLSF